MLQEVDIIILLISAVNSIISFKQQQQKKTFVEKHDLKHSSDSKYKDGLLALPIIFGISTRLTGSRIDEIQLNHTVEPNIS